MPGIARALMDIEAAKAIVENTALTPAVEARLRQQARIRSTHYSTRIEGNKLTLQEAQDVIEKKKTGFHGRERDVHEVRNYWDALLKVEEWAVRKADFDEDLIKRLHAIAANGQNSFVAMDTGRLVDCRQSVESWTSLYFIGNLSAIWPRDRGKIMPGIVKKTKKSAKVNASRPSAIRTGRPAERLQGMS